MTPHQALAAITHYAAGSGNIAIGNLIALQELVIKALNAPASTDKLKELQAEKAELTIRVAELEEQLAEALKPQARTTRRKKNDDDGDDTA